MSRDTLITLRSFEKWQSNNSEQKNTIEQYFNDYVSLYDLNFEEAIADLGIEAQKLKNTIDWNNSKSIKQYVDHLYLLDNLGYEEFVCDEFMKLYNKCVIEAGMKKNNIEILLGAVNSITLHKVESFDLEVGSLKSIVSAVKDLGNMVKWNNIEIKDQDLLQALNNNHKKAEKLLSRTNDKKISPNPARAKSWPLSNRELIKENQR